VKPKAYAIVGRLEGCEDSVYFYRCGSREEALVCFEDDMKVCHAENGSEGEFEFYVTAILVSDTAILSLPI